MKIATRFTLFSWVIIVVITTALVIYARRQINIMGDETVEVAERAINGLARDNVARSTEMLTKAGERIVSMEAEKVASALRITLADREAVPLDVLRADPELRELAVSRIDMPWGVAGHTDVMNDQGEVVWHVNWELEGHNYREWRGEYPEMWALAEQALKTSPVHGDYEFLNPHGEAVKKYMTLIRIPGTEFIVCAAVETAKFFRPIHQTIQAAQNDATIAAKKGIQEAGSKYSDEAQTHLLILGVALLGIGVVSAGGFARSIVRPINRLLAGVQWIGQGRFDTTVEETGSDEVRRLAHEFNALGARLQEYTENLAEARAAEQRAESELRVAASIQQSLLPPLSGFPADRGVALHAVMQSAREVGGDFFDFFFLDERTMCFSVGDVCGKGVPAAILMALSKTLMETAAGMMHDPGKILEMVNDKLSVNNESCVFVTVFVGVLDTVSGELSYSNGGHEPPILVPAAGEPRWFEKPGGPALGLFPKEQFPTTRIKLEQGDCVIVFSDGVTEASDGDLSFFKDKMLNEIKKNSKEPRELVQGLFDRVVRLEQGAQADDITLLAIKFTAEHAAAPTSTAGAAA